MSWVSIVCFKSKPSNLDRIRKGNPDLSKCSGVRRAHSPREFQDAALASEAKERRLPEELWDQERKAEHAPLWKGLSPVLGC